MRVKNILILLAVLAVLGGVYLVVSQPDSGETPQPTVYIWQIEMSDIEHIVISLPREGLSQSFVKLSEGDWRFGDEQQSPIDPDRWGAGITLLLSGPGADRVITEDASQEQLAEYGLTEPSMIITLALADGTTMVIKVGDSTIGGNYYVQVPGTTGVATIDYYWHDVIKRLVTDPPYVTAED